MEWLLGRDREDCLGPIRALFSDDYEFILLCQFAHLSTRIETHITKMALNNSFSSCQNSVCVLRLQELGMSFLKVIKLSVCFMKSMVRITRRIWNYISRYAHNISRKGYQLTWYNWSANNTLDFLTSSDIWHFTYLTCHLSIYILDHFISFFFVGRGITINI